MTWERTCLVLIGWIVGVLMTFSIGLIFAWKQKKLTRKNIFEGIQQVQNPNERN